MTYEIPSFEVAQKKNTQSGVTCVASENSKLLIFALKPSVMSKESPRFDHEQLGLFNESGVSVAGELKILVANFVKTQAKPQIEIAAILGKNAVGDQQKWHLFSSP